MVSCMATMEDGNEQLTVDTTRRDRGATSLAQATRDG